MWVIRCVEKNKAIFGKVLTIRLRFTLRLNCSLQPFPPKIPIKHDKIKKNTTEAGR